MGNQTDWDFLIQGGMFEFFLFAFLERDDDLFSSVIAKVDRAPWTTDKMVGVSLLPVNQGQREAVRYHGL